jgi:hypothetical protein
MEPTSCSATQIPSILRNAKGSLPCPQNPATGIYPEPDKSSPQPPILFLYDTL